MRFKEFLSEKAMNRGEFEKTAIRQATAANVGFEFEMIIPEGSPLYSETSNDDDRETMAISWIDTFDEIQEYFDPHPRTVRKINSDFESWQENAVQGHVDREWENFLSGDADDEDAVQDAKDRARADIDPDRELDFRKWTRDEFANMYEFARAYDLEPVHGWAREDGRHASIYLEAAEDANGTAGTAEAMKYSLQSILKDEIRILSSYHEASKGTDIWYIEPDGSITGRGHGLELVSPPMQLNTAMKTLKVVFNWMQKNDLETNQSTGLHINVSMSGIEDVDLVKLVLFMGDKYVLKQFNRLNNEFTKPQTQSILNNIAGAGTLPKEAKAMIELARKSLSRDKYSSVHIKKLANGYLEFRIAGNKDYHKDYAKIHDTVLRFVSALEVACDPAAERKEYLKKLSLILQAGAAADTNHDLDTKGIVELLRRAGRDEVAVETEGKLQLAKSGHVDSAKNTKWFRMKFLTALMQSLLELNIKTGSDKQRADFKLIMKRLQIDSNLLQGTLDPHEIEVLKRLGIRK